MSSALLWEILRNRSAFLLKQKGTDCTFTREPCNLKGKNTFKYSGLVHSKAIGVETVKDKKGTAKGVVVVTRRQGAARKPVRSFSKVEMKRNARRAMKNIKAVTKNGYRRDLTMAALRRASALLRSQKAVVSKKAAKPKAAAKK